MFVRMATVLLGCLLLTLPAHAASEKGIVAFRPLDDQKNVPERYRLEAHTFAYEMDLKTRLLCSEVDVYRLRFPSPLKSPHAENNTVHAEYYRPPGKGPFPGVIVLDITGGDQMVSRLIATHLAQHGVAGLFVQMAYYGPRRPPGSKLRLLSTNVPQTMKAIQQTVLDLRCAAAWMANRPELDAHRLGILGTSLGSFMGSLTAEMEPRLSRVAILLGGGGLVDAYYDNPLARTPRRLWESLGGTKQKVVELLAPVDPLTCAANLRQRKVLLIAARRDEIVPPRMALAMWEATGRQKIVWFDCTHFGAVAYLVPGLRQVVQHFTAE